MKNSHNRATKKLRSKITELRNNVEIARKKMKVSKY